MWLVLVPHLMRQIGCVWLAWALCNPAWIGSGLTPANARDALAYQVEQFVRGGGPTPQGVVIFKPEEKLMQVADLAPGVGYPRSGVQTNRAGDAKRMTSDPGGEGREATTMEAGLFDLQATADKVQVLLGTALARITGPECEMGPDHEVRMAGMAAPASPLVPSLVDRTRMLQDTLDRTLHFAVNLARHV